MHRTCRLHCLPHARAPPHHMTHLCHLRPQLPPQQPQPQRQAPPQLHAQHSLLPPPPLLQRRSAHGRRPAPPQLWARPTRPTPRRTPCSWGSRSPAAAPAARARARPPGTGTPALQQKQQPRARLPCQQRLPPRPGWPAQQVQTQAHRNVELHGQRCRLLHLWRAGLLNGLAARPCCCQGGRGAPAPVLVLMRRR